MSHVSLRRRFEFATGLVYENHFQINIYSVMLGMITVSEDNEEQNIAYERIKYWINHILNGSVLISENSEKLTAYQTTGQRLIIMPEEPVDQLVGIMLYLKLNVLMENRMVITDVEISSEIGEDMIYTHKTSENIGPFYSDGWWVDPRPVWADSRKKQSKSKVIEMERMPEWGDLDLDWHKDQNRENSTVVFADFNRNEDK